MIFTHTVDVLRDGVTGTVQTAVQVNKGTDKLVYAPTGPMLQAIMLAEPPADGEEVPWKPGDVVVLRGVVSQSPYTVLSVEDRRGSLIPDVRLILKGQMVYV